MQYRFSPGARACVRDVVKGESEKPPFQCARLGSGPSHPRPPPHSRGRRIIEGRGLVLFVCRRRTGSGVRADCSIGASRDTLRQP
jgi:hypothetical protein